MIEIKYSPAMENVKNLLHWFAENKMRPIARQADREYDVPKDFLMEVQKMGIAGRNLPSMEEESEADKKSKDKKASQKNRVSLVGAEELAWGDAAVILTFPGPGLGGPPVTFTGTAEQKKRAFAPFFNQDELHWGAYALTEPNAGSDVSGIQTTCRKEGNHYILNGRKCYITNGARADWNVVFATLDKTKGRAAHRAFLVFKDNPGFRVGKIEKKMGLRASETAELILEDCKIHVDDLLGGEAHYDKASSGGFKTAMATFDSTRPVVGAMAVGIARASYEYVRDWCKERYDFSRPIQRYRDIENTLAEMEAKIATARLMCWKAAWMADEGLPNTKEASMAKAYAGEMGVEVCFQALQLMGPEGLSEDHLVEKWFRDIRVYNIFEGTAQVNRIVVAKRELGYQHN